ncbi:LysR family transcriptional regulator [Halopseudomonas oceani]|uniref:LysR family transcriptional regulator n=1 Tax=Halopseudomonas oceani TaxID=1708783 RepID=A0A2P4EV62_9GAMM|nr:LysR family transcriptional regulator [Halopseudomonas oceani]POB03482.1 LysR family transcriptional regulator [Halopseudomonas oceani]GGE44788.1 LysR family transcriptional regulator [Halopseudomonas oceani]
MDRFKEMQIFQAVAEEQNFSSAARRLGMSAPSVTRAVAALEQRLGTLLLARTTRSVHVTESGQRYVEDCRRILAELDEAEESAGGVHAQARGLLTVTAPVLFGELFVTPVMVDYLANHPAVQIKALLVDRVVNMLDEGIDVAVRIGDLPDGSLHSVQVGEVRRVVCASPGYLARHGRPTHPRDLEAASVVMSASSTLLTEWRFDGPDGCIQVVPQPRLVVTANQAAINAARLGWGITRVLSYQVAELVKAGTLEILLDDYELAPLPIYVVHQGGRRIPAKVREFVDFCVEQLSTNTALQGKGAR